MSEPDHIAQLLGEWQARRLAGEQLEPDEFARAHPELADELLRRLETLDMLDVAFPSIEPTLAHGPGLIADVIGEFRLLRELGRGGMGVVYEAEQTSMQRRVALKVLTPSIVGVQRAVKRFQREARAAGRLHHTNIVPVHAMGQAGGYWFYAMELIEGRPISEVLEAMRIAGPRDSAHRSETWSGTPSSGGDWFREVASAFAGVAEALDLAHAEGVIHRDIKPSNLLLDDDGTLKIVDFGLAHLEGPEPGITLTGDLVGTPGYMSPEQASVKRVQIDHRTDVYSLGATLYEVLVLQPPFDGSNLHELCVQIADVDPPLPRRLDSRIPKDLETIVVRAMEKDRHRRYPHAGDLARDLRLFADGEAIAAQRVGPLGRSWRKIKRHRVRSALVAMVVILAAAGGVLGLQVTREAERRVALEYAQLCATVEEAAQSTYQDGVPTADVDATRQLLAQAVALAPERPEAYLARALLPGELLAPRLADVESARGRGLSEATYHAVRAHLLRGAGRNRDGEVAELLAAGFPLTSPADAFFAGCVRVATGDREEALELFTRAIEGARVNSSIALMGLSRRANVHTALGNLDAALTDLHALGAAGDHGIRLRVRTAAAWRRLGQAKVADHQFEELLVTVRTAGTVAAWSELCSACRVSGAVEWHAQAAAEAHRTHPEAAPLLAEEAEARARAGESQESLRIAELAVQHDPGNHHALKIKAVALETLERFDDAAGAYRKALKQKSDCIDCTVRLGYVLLTSGAREEARLHLEHAVELNPRSVFAHTQLGVTLHRLGELDLAEAEFQRALSLDDDYGSAHLNYGGLLADALQRPREALDHFARSRELQPEVAVTHFNLGLVHQRLGELEPARTALIRAVELEPGRYDYHDWLWKVLQQLGHADERRQRMEDVLERDLPDGPDYLLREAWHLRGHAALGLGRPRAAHAAFTELCAARPGDVEYEVDLAMALQALGRPAEAAEVYRAVLDQDDTMPEVWNNLGNALAATGQIPQALDAFARALNLRPDYLDALSNRGSVLSDVGRLEDALRDYAAALVLAETEWLLRPRAMVLARLSRYDEALASCDRAAELAPDDPRPHVARGAILHDFMRQPERAGAAFHAALERDPNFRPALRNLGIIYATLGQFDKAEAAYDRALAAGPDAVGLRMRRGQVRAASGRLVEAIEDYEAAALLEDHADIHNILADALSLVGEAPRALAARRRALALRPNGALLKNNLAWQLVMASTSTTDDFDEAIALARAATETAAGNATYWNTYGAALCRVEEFTACIEALQESMRLSAGGDAHDWFVLAIAYRGSGDAQQAQVWFDRGARWLEQEQSTDPHLLAWRDEAAQALGRAGK